MRQINMKFQQSTRVSRIPYLWRFCSDQVIRRCIPMHESQTILHFYRASLVGHSLLIPREKFGSRFFLTHSIMK